MRKLNRETLSAEATAFLDVRTQQVRAATDPSEEAQRLWKLQGSMAFKEIRETLKSMASGMQRCMYCEDSAATDIEHFWPKSAYPEKAFTWSNYLLACSGCNSNHKRERFPLDATGAPLLIDPTTEEPREHLTLSPRTGKYVHKSAKGQQSIEVFGLHRDILEKGRQDAWARIPAILRHYDEACTEANWPVALDVQRTICRVPFASVFVWFLDIAAGPSAAVFIRARDLAILEKYPDIKGWL